MKRPLPGRQAQLRLAPADVPDRFEVPRHARRAAVLMLLFPCHGHWALALIRRTSHEPRDRHAGQIAFPGGRAEKGDADLRFTAVREAHEEIGVLPSALHHLGALSPLYIPVSNYLVHPFLAWTQQRPDFRLQAGEVAELLEPPVLHLLQPEVLTCRPMRLSSGKFLPRVPCYVWQGNVIWGASAMMLSELLEIVSASIGAGLSH